MRVLLLSGGGWHGAVQDPILQSLDPFDFDLVLGVSVGGILGATFACGKKEVSKRFWDEMDDRTPLDGIKNFLSPALLGGKGLFHLGPMRRQMELHGVDERHLQVAFGAGVVRRESSTYETGIYRGVRTNEKLWQSMSAGFGAPSLEMVDTVEASAAIAVAMAPVVSKAGVFCDGGHVHVLPRVPDGLLPAVTSITAVFCKPPSQADVAPRSKVDGLVEALNWAIARQMEAPRAADYLWLKAVASMGVPVVVYAPRGIHGGTLDARREDIAARRALGVEALANPQRL